MFSEESLHSDIQCAVDGKLKQLETYQSKLTHRCNKATLCELDTGYSYKCGRLFLVISD